MTSPKVTPRRPAGLGDLLLFGLALAAISAGLVLFWSARTERVVHEAEAAAMWLRVEHAEWLRDGMLHPGTAAFGMPPAMMEGLPAEQVQRLNVEFSVHNRGATTESFNIAELSLHAQSGAVWEARPDEDGANVVLGPRQRYAAVVQFDVPEEERSPQD